MSDYKHQAKRPYWTMYGNNAILFYDEGGTNTILWVDKEAVYIGGYDNDDQVGNVGPNSTGCFLEAFRAACELQRDLQQE